MIVAAADNFRENLSTYIEARGLKKVEIAAAIKSSRSYVDDVLKGNVDPSLSRCEALAKAVGLPLTSLFESPADFTSSVLTPVR
jgi:transcriptional regulator with XRE-family HTH domain